MIKKIDKILSRITTSFGYVSYVSIVFIMLLVVVDVIMRKILRAGILGSYEIVERALLLLIFAAFAFTQTEKAHVHVTLFVSKLPKPVGMFIFGFLGVLSTSAAVFCAYSMVEQGKFSFEKYTTTAVLLIPLYPFFYIAGVCMYIFAVVLLWDSVKSFIGIKNEEICKEIRSAWE